MDIWQALDSVVDDGEWWAMAAGMGLGMMVVSMTLGILAAVCERDGDGMEC